MVNLGMRCETRDSERAAGRNPAGSRTIDAYNMVNPRVIQRERSLCSPNENPDVAREFAVADELPRCGAATRKRVAQTKGTKDKTGGSMWAPF
jgi:hypothetical protein